MDAHVIAVGVCPWSFVVGGRPNHCLPSVRTPLFRCANQPLKRRSSRAIVESASRSTIQGGSEIDQEDVLQVFLEERKLTGDFISKVSDALWRRDGLMSDEPEKVSGRKDTSQVEEVQFAKSVEDEGYTGFPKLIKTKEWISGEGLALTNRKLSAQGRFYNCERMRKLNKLQYEALKREMLLSTAGIGVACSGYCLLTLSMQAAVSYMIGVAFRSVMDNMHRTTIQTLLCYHSDNLSQKDVPLLFLQKSSKKIGIRSEDLKNLIERTMKGSLIAFSSPRLVIPVALYGIWGLSHQLASNFFDFQIVPAMLGLFAYKAAALVQVYRDNKGLSLILPQNDEFSDN